VVGDGRVVTEVAPLFVKCILLQDNYIVTLTELYMIRAEEIEDILQKERTLIIKLETGQKGVTFETLFGEYLESNPAVIAIEDPHVRTDFQIENFLRFCEVVVKISKKTTRIVLVTNTDEERSRKIRTIEKLEEAKQTLAECNISFGIPWSLCILLCRHHY
jgi:ATP-dependent Lon protease